VERLGKDLPQLPHLSPVHAGRIRRPFFRARARRAALPGRRREKMNQKMRRQIVILFISLSSLAIASHSQNGAQDARLADACKTYLQTPSKKSAIQLYQALPDNLVSAHQVYLSQQKSLQSIFNNFSVLRRQVLSRDRYSIKIAFKLLAVSDGDFGEILSQVLGQLIKPAPRMFLEELQAHRTLVRSLGSLTGNLGEEYIDEFSKAVQELKARIKALQTIKVKNLIGTRDECIKSLMESCNWYSE